MTPSPKHLPPRALAYTRVSTDAQTESGAGLDAQRATIDAALAGRGWSVEYVVEEGRSAKDLNRPVLADALARLDAGEADVLVVSKLDRLSRSVLDFAGLVQRADRRGWSVLCLDVNVDTTTPAGGFMASVMSASAEYERKLTGQRTRDALAAKRAAGVRLGRPRTLPLDVVARIVAAHAEGQPQRAIARVLEEEGVPTAHGGTTWRQSSVAAVLRSKDAQGVRAGRAPTE